MKRGDICHPFSAEIYLLVSSLTGTHTAINPTANTVQNTVAMSVHTSFIG